MTPPAYYAAMAESNEALATAYDWQAKAYEAIGHDGVAVELARAATFRRLAESYRRMAAGNFDAASEAINAPSRPVVVGHVLGDVPVTVDPQ